jgi:hypothetical protein
VNQDGIVILNIYLHAYSLRLGSDPTEPQTRIKWFRSHGRWSAVVMSACLSLFCI